MAIKSILIHTHRRLPIGIVTEIAVPKINAVALTFARSLKPLPPPDFGVAGIFILLSTWRIGWRNPWHFLDLDQ